MPGAARIHIEGQAELERAFLSLRREVLRGLKPALMEIGEVVRVEAEERAVSEISNIGPRWSRMRIGAVLSGLYIAPKSRRRGGSPRSNLAPMLLDAMQGAADAKEHEVVAAVETLVDVAAAKNGFF